jgi:hypothetical protein
VIHARRETKTAPIGEGVPDRLEKSVAHAADDEAGKV